ncbi:MAG: tetratricopeptide repeat protein [Planctomycetota bacterium]
MITLLSLAVLAWLLWPAIPNWRASVALQTRDTTTASFWLDAAEVGVSNHPETTFLRARWKRRLGDLAGVRFYLEKAHKCGVARQRLEREQWMTLAQSGQMREAEPHFAELVSDPGHDIHEICEAYTAGYVRLHRYGDAIKVLDAWLADYPESSYARLLRGRVLRHLDRAHEAETDLRRAVTNSPNLVEAQFELAQVLRESKRPEEAIQHYDKCLSDVQLANPARIGRSISLKMIGQVDKAREQLRQLVANSPEQADAAYELGLLELEAGDAQSAVEHLQRASKLNPTKLEMRYSLCQALQMSGRHEEAAAEMAFVEEARGVSEKIQRLSDASQANPADAEIRFELGEFLIRQGRETEGVSWLQSVLQIFPGHAGARRLLDLHNSPKVPSASPQSQQLQR